MSQKGRTEPTKQCSEVPVTRWEAFGRWLSGEVDGCTCAGGGMWPHEAGCGFEPLYQFPEGTDESVLRALVTEHNAAIAKIDAAKDFVVALFKLFDSAIREGNERAVVKHAAQELHEMLESDL